MCIYIYIKVYIYIFIYAFVGVYKYVRVYLSIINMYVYKCKGVYIIIYICMYEDIDKLKYTYIYM